MKHLVFTIITLLLSIEMMADGKGVPLICELSRPYEVAAGLEGRHIALWGSHGMYYNIDQDRWMWQRARVWTTVEDLFTSSFTAPYLVPMLENAGAVVMQPRAYVRPNYQTIYIRWEKKPRPAPVTIQLQQGNTVRTFQINTSIGGGLWHYLCTIPKGEYQLIGLDHMSIDEHTMGPSGWPRYMEAARYWVPYTGVPDSAWIKDTTYTDYRNDIVCRGGWVNYLCGGSRVNNRTAGVGIPLDMSVAVHSDAGITMNDSIIGTLLIYSNRTDNGCHCLPTGESCTVSASLADSVLQQIMSDIQRTFCPSWTNRQIKQANYGETRSPLVPAVIIEMLSHQNYADMQYGLDPRFRFTIARAIYKGIGRYLAAKYQTCFVPEPLTPKALRTSLDGDSIYLSWQPQVDTLESSAAATYYIVYTRTNGGTWDNGVRTDTTCFSTPLVIDQQYDFCVAAGNAGGISLRSAVVSAYHGYANDIPMLIVDAFDEVRGPKMMAFDSLTGGIVPGARPIPDGYEMAYLGEQINYNRKDVWHSDDDCGFGMCNMKHMGQFVAGNTHDYTAQHGRALHGIQRSYVSCTMDALTCADSLFTQVDIILGKSNPQTVKDMLEYVTDLHWMERNSHVLISGAYVNYPFTGCASGQVRMDSTIYTFHQELNPTHLSAEDVSALTKSSPTDTILMRYTDTALPAAIENEHCTIVGFPLETLDDFETVYTRLIQ